jgi:hypothetical protein
MKYTALFILIAILFLLSWKLVDRNNSSGTSFSTWQSSTFDVASEKAKVKAVKDAASLDQSTKQSKTETDNVNTTTFGDEYERFLSEQKKISIPRYQELGFANQESYEEAYSAEFRFLLDEFEQHMTQYLRVEQFTEDQIDAIFSIESAYKADLREIYRVKEEDDTAQYAQRGKARQLSTSRHKNLLEVVTPEKLNSIEQESMRFFKTAKEKFNLKAYEYHR